MNIGLAVILCLANEKKNQAFDEYAAGVAARLLEKCPENKAFLERFDIHYYIADNPNDKSIARIVDADYADCALQNGRKFGIIVNKGVLAKLATEDSFAFVLGHELSHIMYQKRHPLVKVLAADEETACDCNSLKMMNAGGYNLLDIAAVDALYPEMQERIVERDCFMQKNGIFPADRPDMSRPLQKETFIHLQKEPWKRDSIFAQNEPDAARIAQELGDIFERGDRTDFQREFRDLLQRKPTEESSKILMNVFRACYV